MSTTEETIAPNRLSVSRLHALQGVIGAAVGVYGARIGWLLDRSNFPATAEEARGMFARLYFAPKEEEAEYNRSLIIYAFACAHFIGYSFLVSSDAKSQWHSMFQLFVMAAFGILISQFMPDGNIGAVLTLFSGTGALVKVCTTQRTGYGTYDVPTEDRVLYLSVEKPKDRYNQFVVHELVAYGLTILYFTASLVILPEYKLDLFRATNMENKNSLGLISLCLFLTGMISHSSIPAMRQGKFSMVYLIAWSHFVLRVILVAFGEHLPLWFLVLTHGPLGIYGICCYILLFMKYAFGNTFSIFDFKKGHLSGAQAFTDNIESIGNVFVLNAIFLTEAWRYCVMFNVAWPKFSLTFIDVRSYVHNPLIGPIYDTIYWIANMFGSTRLLLVLLNPKRFPWIKIENSNAIFEGDSALVHSSYLFFVLAMYVAGALVLNVSRAASTSDFKTRGLGRVVFCIIMSGYMYIMSDKNYVSYSIHGNFLTNSESDLKYAPQLSGVLITVFVSLCIALFTSYQAIGYIVPFAMSTSVPESSHSWKKGPLKDMIVLFCKIRKQTERFWCLHGLALLLAIVFFRAVERTGLPNPLATSDEELYIIRPIETQGTDNTMTLLTILVVLKLAVVSTDWFSALRGDVFKRFSALFSWVIFGTQVLKLVSGGKCDVFAHAFTSLFLNGKIKLSEIKCESITFATLSLLSLAFHVKLSLHLISRTENSRLSVVSSAKSVVMLSGFLFGALSSASCVFTTYRVLLKQSGDKYLSACMNDMVRDQYEMLNILFSGIVLGKLIHPTQGGFAFRSYLKLTKKCLLANAAIAAYVVMSRSIYNSRYAIFWVFGTSPKSHDDVFVITFGLRLFYVALVNVINLYILDITKNEHKPILRCKCLALRAMGVKRSTSEIKQSLRMLSKSKSKSESKTGDGKTDDVSEKQKSPKKTNKWTNFWRDCYQQHFGMENLEKNTLTEFPIPMPDDNYFGLFMAKLKAALMFIFGALVNRRRSTHPVGVGAIGDFQVIENPKIPKNAFFSKSKKYSIILRHSNAVGVKLADKDEFDDAALEIRGCSIKFSCQSDESDFDLHLNTGEFAGFFNLPSFLEFVYQSATFNEALYKVFATKYPSSVKAVIDGVRRAPNSYCDLHYYSQTCREFNALDGRKRYCKFRLVPYGDGPGTEVKDEPSKPNLEDQHTITTTHMMKCRRSAEEKRPTDYLRREFIERVGSSSIKYRLQIQLYEAKSTDTSEVFNPNRSWDTTFHDVGVLSLHSPLPDSFIENCSFAMARTPNCLSLLPATCAEDYNSLNYTRASVYKTSARIRRVFTRNKKSHICQPARYTVTIRTSSIAKAGVNTDINILIVGTRHSTKTMKLEVSESEFGTGATSVFKALDEDIGEPAYLVITHGDKTAWNCGRVDVRVRSQDGTVRKVCFNVWSVIHANKAFIVPRVVNDSVSSRCRKLVEYATELYLHQMRQSFDWSYGDYLPNHTTYDEHAKLPLTEQFSSTKYKDFFYDTFTGFKNKGFADRIPDKDIKCLDDYVKLYRSLKPVDVVKDWHSDEECGRQFLNGTHPVQIRKIDVLPSKFKVTEADVAGVLPAGRSLQGELAAGHIYMVDFKILEGIKRGENYFVENSMGLFFADENNALRPIAIQHFQDGSGPIWTPKDGKYEWYLARLHLICSDGNVHQMISHLLKTHLLMEPWAVCLERNVPRNHVVYRIMRPHLIYVIAINTLGRSMLISPGGVTDRVVAVGQGGHMDLMSKAYQEFKFEHLHIPNDFKRRGVDKKNILKNYYYRDDAMEGWTILRKYISRVLKLHYPNDDSVRADTHVQSMILEMRNHGYQGKNAEQHGIPSSINSFEQLVDVCTSVMYQCSFMHAAVNFSQWDYYSCVPNRPLLMRKPAPKTKVNVTEQDVIDALPNVAQCTQTMATGWTLSQFSKEEVYIGRYITDMLDGNEERDALGDFHRDLDAMASRIEERNKRLLKPYPYMHPSRVPTNIGV